MNKQWNMGNEKKRYIIAAVAGAVTAIMISLCGSLIVGLLIQTGSIGETSGLYSPIIWMLSSFAGTLCACRISKGRYLLISLITVLIYVGILYIISVSVFDGRLSKIGQGILCVFAGMIPGVFLHTGRNSTGSRKIKYKGI